MSACMHRRALHPAGSRGIPVAVLYPKAARAGDLRVTRGQRDRDAHGRVRHGAEHAARIVALEVP